MLREIVHDSDWQASKRPTAVPPSVDIDGLNGLAAPPGNRLERFRGDRRGQHSIRISDQYRICFEWRDGDAHNVEIVDYH